MDVRVLRLVARAAVAGLVCASLLSGSAASATGPAPARAPARDPFALAAERYTLPSGMTVLLRRSPSVPRVVVSLWFGVGSRDEAAGKTGFAHLYEHLMFMGTKNVPNGQFDQVMESVGGANNATTSNDRTFYFDFGPSHILPTLLWLEAERLTYLPEAMTDEKVALQREVVRNERRQSYENRPYGGAELRLVEAMYPKGHPYSWPVIGSHQDLIAATTDDVKQFFYTYYTPSNATLAVVGDFDPAEAKRLIQRYFGWMPKRPRPQAVARPQPLTAPVEKQVTIRDRVALPRLYLAWHAPATPSGGAGGDGGAGLAETQLIADVLGKGKASRLYRALVVEQKLASAVEVELEPLSFGSLLVVSLTAQPGVAAEALGAAAQRELVRMTEQPPGPEEIQRARSQRLTELAGEIETPLGQSLWLQQLYAWMGDPAALPKLVQRLREATPERLKARCVGLGLGDPARRVTLTVLPGDKPVEPTPPAVVRAASAAFAPPAPPKPPLDLSKAPGLLKERPLPVPRTARVKVKDLDVLLLARPGTPLTEVVVTVPTGEIAAPPDQSGLPAAVAAMLTEGAGDRTATQVAEALASVGAQLKQSVTSDTTTLTLSVMTENFAAAAPILADVLLRPRLEEADWQRVRAERLAMLMRQRDEPGPLAERALRSSLYGDSHPLGRLPVGDEPSLRRIDVAGLRFFHKTNFHPSRLQIVLAGDLVPSEATAAKLLAPLVQEAVPPAPPVTPVAPMLAQPPAAFRGLVLVDRPGAPQSEVQVANLALGRRDPQRVPAEVANALLGGMFTSRLNQNLREQHGYTYGAKSQLSRLDQSGWFVAHAAVRTDVTAASLGEIRKELLRLRDEPVSAEELRKGKNAAVQHLVAQSERTAGLAQLYAGLLRYGLPLDELGRFWRDVQAVTPESLQAVVRAAMRPEEAAIIVVGDTQKVAAPLQQLLGQGFPVRRVGAAPAAATPAAGAKK